ncbi:MAG: undecaprenyldiphospho-muramoylpentapeptide beta-N-acetylglucosaminyltransferase [bacterium]
MHSGLEDRSREPLRVLFAAGGTGGHLFPALAVAQELMGRAPASRVLFAGTRKGMEALLVPRAGFEIAFISIYGLRRRMSASNLALPFFGLKSLFQSFLILRRFSPDVVFGTGGYVAGPVLLGAVLSRIPTVLHEQNSRPGLTARWLARWVSMVLLSFPQSEAYFRRKENLRVTGNPTRLGLEAGDRRAARRLFGLREDVRTLLVFGGSLGAHSINMAVLDALEELTAEQDVQLLWQTGRLDFEGIRDRVSQSGVRVLPFIDEMVDAYQAADVVLCRAGATTLAEITRCGLPAILVPYPRATGGHQEFNARILVEAGAAAMIPDQELSGRKVAAAVLNILKDTEKRERMRNRSKAMGSPRAATDIVEALFELVSRRKGNDEAPG